MDTPILNSLKKLKDEKSISFHTPGHKGKNTLINWGDLIPFVDTTEVEGMDNLHNPKGIIKESQDLTARAFGAKKTIYSINGTTGGNYIGLSAVTDPGDTILIQRNSHKSIYSGAVLNRLKSRYIYPYYDKENHLVTKVSPQDIERELKENKDIKVVCLTYPSYYGITCDLEEIAKIVHRYDRLLLVDEAHGSHFYFSDKLPKSALECGADLVVQSTHKTLASFTQTSMLHIGTDKIDYDKLVERASLYQSTSPSYLFLASLEIARAYMERGGREKLEETINTIEVSLKKLKTIEGLIVYDDDKKKKDISKILFRFEGMTGVDLMKILYEEYNIRLEMADYYYALALTSLLNQKEDFESLYEALNDISKKNTSKKIPNLDVNTIKPKIVLPIYQAYYSKKIKVDLKDSIGKVSNSFIIPYPPGIPLICPGEEISQEIYDYIQILIKRGIEIIGLMGYNKEKIHVIS